jgi:hypothetical protein
MHLWISVHPQRFFIGGEWAVNEVMRIPATMKDFCLTVKNDLPDQRS